MKKNDDKFLVILRGNISDLREQELISIFRTYNLDITSLINLEKSLYSFNSIYFRDLVIANRLDFINMILSRTAYIKSVYSILFEIDLSTINNINFNYYTNKNELFSLLSSSLKQYIGNFRGSFSVHFKNFLTSSLEISEKELGEIVWELSIDKKVDLKNPENDFFFIFTSKKIFFTKRIFNHNKEFLKRMPTKRPMNNPYTLKSDLARAAVNFLELKEGLILDPFCGFGAILLEAEDMNLYSIGIDIKWKDLKAAQENFYYFFKKKPFLILSDSNFQIFKNNTLDGIVTDIPYGKSTRVVGEELYLNFLKNSYEMLKKGKRLVVICSNYFDIGKLLEKASFVIEKKIEIYINRSMMRYLYICKK